MAKLIVLDGDDKGQVYIMRSRNILGRHTECSFKMTDKGVSGKHCKIEQINQRDFQISDLNSSNGTYVNGKRIITQKLNYGDIIGLGKIRIIFQPTTEKSLYDSTMMMDMAAFISESEGLTHCDKPLAREWRYCPYCGEQLKWIDREEK
ncbi:MAG: FHA protein [uncultured bacterium]|nr:MAG: FHA protein [uncultured bacterium]